MNEDCGNVVLLRKCKKYDTFDYNEARIYRCEVEPFGRRV